jgi:hypothetical protein
MSEILLAIAPIPRHEQGNFSTPTRNFLDRPRCTGWQQNARLSLRWFWICFGFISGAIMHFAYLRVAGLQQMERRGPRAGICFS